MKKFLSNIDELYLVIMGYATVLVFIFIVTIVIPAHFEASTFNKFKSADQPEATIIDAMFSRLRVGTDE